MVPDSFARSVEGIKKFWSLICGAAGLAIMAVSAALGEEECAGILGDGFLADMTPTVALPFPRPELTPRPTEVIDVTLAPSRELLQAAGRAVLLHAWRLPVPDEVSTSSVALRDLIESSPVADSAEWVFRDFPAPGVVSTTTVAHVIGSPQAAEDVVPRWWSVTLSSSIELLHAADDAVPVFWHVSTPSGPVSLALHPDQPVVAFRYAPVPVARALEPDPPQARFVRQLFANVLSTLQDPEELARILVEVAVVAPFVSLAWKAVNQIRSRVWGSIYCRGKKRDKDDEEDSREDDKDRIEAPDLHPMLDDESKRLLLSTEKACAQVLRYFEQVPLSRIAEVVAATGLTREDAGAAVRLMKFLHEPNCFWHRPRSALFG